MAATFISVASDVTTATHARKLLALREALKEAYEQANEIKNIMVQMKDGSDFSLIETKFGLAAGLGDDVFDLVNGAAGAMDNTFQNGNIKTIVERIG